MTEIEEQTDLFGPIEKKIIRKDLNKAKREQIKDIIRRNKEVIEKEYHKSTPTGFEAAVLQVTDWNPYDQNSVSPFLDIEWMFGMTEGFDIVIGNPPYRQLQADNGKLAKLYEPCNYQTFNKTGDIYCLFYERAFQLLRQNGILCFITLNKWMQTAYGMELRKFLSHKHIVSIIDFGDVQVFDNATTYTCIPLFFNTSPAIEFRAACLKTFDISNVNDLFQVFKSKDLGADTWILSSASELKIITRLKTTFKPLKEYINGEAYRGVVTGLTNAFIINDATAASLIQKDQNAADVLHPVIRGRDIKAYQKADSDSWLIGTFPALNLNIDNYPSIKQWLLSFGCQKLEQTGKEYIINGEIIKSRKKTANKWFETQDQIKYYREFYKPKIMYQAFQVKPNFIYDESGCFCNNSMWILPTENKALLGLLNSQMGWWLISKFCSQIQNGYQLIWKYFGEIPITLGSEKDQEKLVALVNKILKTKERDSKANIDKELSIIDSIVFDLYGLTQDERKIILQES